MNLKKILALTSLLLLAAFSAFSQATDHPATGNDMEKQIAERLSKTQLVFDKDSINGFDEEAARKLVAMKGAEKWEQLLFIAQLKRNYINAKYGIQTTNNNAKPFNPDPAVQSSCMNVDFETGTIAGWYMTEGNNYNSITMGGCCPNATSRYSIVSPGADPNIPGLATVPPGGGNWALKIGDGNVAGGYVVRAKQTFNVTAASSVFIYKFAVVLQDAGHECVDQPYFNVSFTDCNNNPIPCGNYNVVNASSSCSYGDPSFVTYGSFQWKDWTTRSFDLTAYIGSCVSIEFTAGDCVQTGHSGWAYVDCSCQPMTLNLNGVDIPVGQTNNAYLCASGTNILCAPTGFTSYSWTGPGVNGQAGQCVNPSAAGSYSVTLGMAGDNCNPPVLYCNFNTFPKPVADFSFTTTPCQTTFTVPFQNTSNPNGGPAITTAWDFDNNGTPDDLANNPVYTFPGGGTYQVGLEVSNPGCKDKIVKSIVITAKPTADFNVLNTCLNTAASFTNTGTPSVGIASYVWDFGDNTTGSGADPSHIYSTPGTYTIQQMVTTADLCKDTIAKVLTIFPIPAVHFSSNTVCLNEATIFTNSTTVSTGSITNWEWDFNDDGAVDNTTQNPTNTYAAPGVYTVELKATTDNGCRDSSVINALVNALPTPLFTSANACVNFNIALADNSSIPAPDAVNSYTWNFGANANPASSSNQNPPSLIYNTPGIKTITLTVKANTTCTATTTQTVEVYPQPVANFSTTSVCQSTATAFTDLSTTTVGTITGWDWDFQNDAAMDNTTTGTPSFTYSSSGTFTTLLIATTSHGCKDTVLRPVNVWGHSIPNFTPDNVCFGTATTFSNLTNTTTNANVGGIPAYYWYFTDGFSANSINPIHTFTLNGNANATYNVLLVATSTHNCIDSIRKPVSVFALPTASFTSDSVCLGSASHMADASNGNGNTINNFEWDFLNNGLDISGVPNPNYVFPGYGNNIVSYTVSSFPVVGLVCKNITNTITVWVNPNPEPDFTFTDKCINAQPNSFDASTSSIGVGTNTNYAWAYGDGSTGNGITTSHNYAMPSVYNVTLTVTSNKGCQNKIVKQTEVFAKPFMAIANSSACDGKVMTFTASTLPNSGNVTAWFWDFNQSIASFEATGQTSGYIFPAAGNQLVTLISKTDKGCLDTLHKTVYVDYVPVPQFTVNKPAGCPVHCVTFSDNTPPITGPAQNTTWIWLFGDGNTLTAHSGSVQPHCYDNTTGDELKSFDIKLVVITDKGCTDSIKKASFITVYPEPVAAYEASPNPGNVVTPLVYFTNQSHYYTRWWWNFGDGTARDSVNRDPEHFYYDASAKTYPTYLVVANQYGCRDTAYLKVDIGPEFTFYIPNAFTPDMDGLNDYFSGKGIGIETFEMWVFDRWGEMVFYSDDITKGWDGKRQGKSQDCKQDVYVWKVKLKDVLGKQHTYTGHVTLIR